MKKTSILLLALSILSCIKRDEYFAFENSCELLELSFETLAFSQEFFLCTKEVHKIFRVYDKSQYFKNCAFLLSCGGNVHVAETPLVKEEFRNPSNLILEKIETRGSKHKLYYYRPYSGAVVILTFKKENGIFHLLSYRVGTI